MKTVRSRKKRLSLPQQILSAILSCLLVSSVALMGCSSNTNEQTNDDAAAIEGGLVIIHTNDIHGYDMPAEATENSPGVIGIASVAQLKKDYEAQGYQVLLLDSGDSIQDNVLVNLSHGQSAIEFMNSAGYDAMTIGNHEFDWAQGNLEKLIDEANFPVLSANISVEESGDSYVDANTIIELEGGVKVGIFGLTTPETQTKSNPKNVAGLHFASEDDLYSCAQEQIDYLRGEGCSIVICLGHLGSIGGEEPNRSIDVLENTEGIDLFIDGHDHQVVNQETGGALLVSTGCHLENIGVVHYEEGVFTEEMVSYGSYDGVDPATDELVRKINDEVNAELAETIGRTEVALNGEREPGVRTNETNLGDFTADAMLWQAKQAADQNVDAAFVNGGSIRASIAEGDISMATMLTVFPYQNSLNIVTLKGSELLEVLEAGTALLPEAMGSFPQVAGITYTIDTTVAYENGEQYPDSTYYGPAKPGARVSISDVGGRGFDLDAEYVVAVTDFISSGGDTYYAVAQAYRNNGFTTGYSDTDALINYIQTELGGTIGQAYAAPQGRITVK